MYLRKYQSEDCKELTELFYHTVHTVNAKDYTKEQLDAWATGQVDLAQWNHSLLEHYSIVAVENGRIAGFGDIDETGYLDRLYVRADMQGEGVATAICDRLESIVEGTIVTHASITAKPFFEKRGYAIVREQQVERRGILLTNYVMELRRKKGKIQIQELDIRDRKTVEEMMLKIFSVEPWNDEWTSEQLQAYVSELMSERNSLSFGIYEDDVLAGIALGKVKSWYEGKEYWLEEFGILPEIQGSGIGSVFMESLEEKLMEGGVIHIVLLTDRHVPAYHFYQKNGFVEKEGTVVFTKTLKDGR